MPNAMEDDSMKPKETIITKYKLSTEAISGGDGDQIGEDIPDDKTRYVIGLIISGDTANKLEVMLGDTADNDRETLLLLELECKNPQTFGSFDPEKPLLVCRPERASGGSTITKNRLAIAHESNAFSVTAVYYDAP